MDPGFPQSGEYLHPSDLPEPPTEQVSVHDPVAVTGDDDAVAGPCEWRGRLEDVQKGCSVSATPAEDSTYLAALPDPARRWKAVPPGGDP